MMNFQLEHWSLSSTLANALRESFPPHRQHLATPSTHTITPSYSTQATDATSFGTPTPRPTLPVAVLSISSETSASSFSTLANALGESFPPHQQHLLPPSIHTITPSYSTQAADAAFFWTSTPRPTLSVGGPVSSISSETSASPCQDTSPIALNVAAVVGQEFRGSRRHLCDKCGASFRQKQVRNRHFRDKHLPPGTCPKCPFKFPKGRPGVLKAHLKEYHTPSRSLTTESRGA